MWRWSNLQLGYALVLLFFFNEPNYTSIYSGLSQEDASKVVEYLANQKVLYKIDDNGQTIKVPYEKVYELRLALAGKGIPSSGVIGYEIFDKTTMGMSEFMQKLNYKRSSKVNLQELFNNRKVVGARVHIVIPQKQSLRKKKNFRLFQLSLSSKAI